MLTAIQKSTKIGNSWGTVIPTQFWEALGVKPGSRLVFQAADGKLVISGEGTNVSSITPEFVEMVEDVHKRYGPALAKLAKK